MTAIKELIRKRKSLVLYADKPVEQEKMDLIFESARWAPSSFNEQPWRFIYAHRSDEKNYNKMEAALNDANRKWAAEAPVLIAVLAKKNFTHNNKANKHAFYDVGQSVATLALQATDLDLYLRQMAGFYPDVIIENLQIPDEFEPVALIALGYQGTVKEDTDERLAWKQEHERTRREFDELVMEGSWN